VAYLLAALLWLLVFSAPGKDTASKSTTVLKVLAVNILCMVGCWQIAVWCVEALA
jgi:hypothetical protein